MTSTPIEFRKLHHVVVLAQERSFVRAAEALRLTQPALTRSIQSVERRYGIRLFDRNRASVTLTAVGREFLHRAQSLLIEANDLTRFAERIGRGEAGEVAFGLSTLPAKLFLPPLMLDLFETRPGLRCSVAVRDPVELLQMLAAETIEFYLAAEVPESPSAALEITEFAEMPTVLAVRPGHPLLSRAGLGFGDLADYPLLVGRFEPGPRAPAELLQLHPAALKTDDYGALLQLTLKSDAIWLTTLPPGRDDRPDAAPWAELATLPLSLGRPPLVLKGVRLARRTLSPAARDLFDDLRRRCARLSEANLSF
jgi:DNA-binding transcriptional LysR family regulator